jgi:chromosome segregation ATPase
VEVFYDGWDKEIRVNASFHDDRQPEYATSRRVQVWFLRRSRANWKNKYGELKADAKRLQNRVNDVTKSREQWRLEAKQQARRIQELEAQNAVLQEQMAALKKEGQLSGAGCAR